MVSQEDEMDVEIAAIGQCMVEPGDSRRWEDMLAVWVACDRANVEPPREVRCFFAGRRPTPFEIEEAVSEWRSEAAQGLDVDLRKISQDIQIIRFVNETQPADYELAHGGWRMK